MLEHSLIWLGPWQPVSPPQLGRRRLILDAHSQIQLGQARQSKVRRWLAWVYLPPIQVLEGADESLLLFLDRYWGLPPTWVVRDADGKAVGALQGKSVSDSLGHCWSRRQASANGKTRRWLDPAGNELACSQPDRGGILLRFADPQTSPFQRMVLLADSVAR